MKSFLAAWLAEAPKALARELGGDPELCPSAQLPQPETATSLAVSFEGPYGGHFLVTADRYALHALLAAARLTDGSLDADRDRELWRSILRQIAIHAIEAFDPSQASAISIRVEDAAWTLGLPSAAYELRFANAVLLVAFTDQLEISQRESSESVDQTTNESPHAPEKPRESAPLITSDMSSAHGSTQSSNFSSSSVQAGIDLLLDIELEASLRFGSREMALNELLDLGAGDVVELDRHISDPVDLLVGDKIVARGEVVLVNGSFGLRVLEVSEPRKCLESIRCLF